jgi:L-alanine-DL-glutamate epimerase-like enolase superfamily enzyme
MRRIATIAEAHYVPVAPHNPMGPLATAVNVHFAAATQNFSILEYRLPVGPVYVYGGTEVETREDTSGYVADPYLPKDGYLELRPDRPGWGVEMDEDYMRANGYVHWQRKVPKRPDGSYAFA